MGIRERIEWRRDRRHRTGSPREFRPLASARHEKGREVQNLRADSGREDRSRLPERNAQQADEGRRVQSCLERNRHDQSRRRDRATGTGKTDAILVCDGAQSAPHFPVSFDSLGVDFYAFSGHKMLGPMGIGGLIGKREMLEEMPPYQTGGDMIEFVHDERTTWNILPLKFEAGTPNAANAVGLAAAVEYLDNIGMDRVLSHERALMSAAQKRLAAIEGLHIYGPPPSERSGVLSFTLGDVHPHDIATILDGEGVCIRAGHHCAQPLMRRLDVTATARASFYVYNDESDIDALVAGILKAREIFGYVPV